MPSQSLPRRNISHVFRLAVLGDAHLLAKCQWNITMHFTAMRTGAIILSFRFSSHRHSLEPLTVTLRKHSAASYSPCGSGSERMFSHGTLPKNSPSGPEASRHESAAKPCLRENEAWCLDHQQLRVTNKSRDQGVGRSPFLDAALAAFMGIGIGELQ